MSTFIMLTELDPDSIEEPDDYEELEQRVMNAVRSECGGVDWVSSYALSGPWSYLDVFRAPDVETATKVALLFQTLANVRTEVWPAMEWSRFKTVLHELPSTGEMQAGHPS